MNGRSNVSRDDDDDDATRRWRVDTTTRTVLFVRNLTPRLCHETEMIQSGKLNYVVKEKKMEIIMIRKGKLHAGIRDRIRTVL